METQRNALGSRVFDGLPSEARDACLAAARRLNLKAGSWLARQGDPATTLYLIDDGVLKIIQETAQGQQLIVRLAGPGDPFGGVAALESAPYPVSAVVLEPTVVYAWSGNGLHQMLTSHPQTRANLMREMTTHMTDALTRVREMTTMMVGPRIATTLIRLARHCGRDTSQGILITHPLTRQEIADLVGTTLYTVSRTLSQWDTDGIIKSQQRRLLIISPGRLARLAVPDEPDN